MVNQIGLSVVQALPLLHARKNGQPTAVTSPNLGINRIEVALFDQYVQFPDGQRVGWDCLEEIADKTGNCFLVRPEGVEKIQIFSPVTNRLCSLMPTQRAPTMLLAG